MSGTNGTVYYNERPGPIVFPHFYASLLAAEGITANSITPGPIATGMAAALPGLHPDLVPVGRFGTVEEVAAVAVMLFHDGYITGQTININGGRYMT